MSVFLKVLKGISRVFLYIGYAAILVMLVMTVIDVVLRFFFGRPMSGVTEWSQILLIVSMTTLAYAIIEGRNIAVGVLVERFPKNLNIAFEVLMGVLSVVFFLVVGWQLMLQIGTSIKFRESYFVIKMPRWPMYAILGASFLSSVLGTIVYVIERIINFKDPSEKTLFDENPDLAILAFTDEHDKQEGGAE